MYPGAELSRQLAAGAGPYNIQAAQVRVILSDRLLANSHALTLGLALATAAFLQGSMDAGNSAQRADSGSAGAAGKPEESQALTEEALHLKRIQVSPLCCIFSH